MARINEQENPRQKTYGYSSRLPKSWRYAVQMRQLVSEASLFKKLKMSDKFSHEAVAIESRSDFANWAIERARMIVAHQGGDLALAARDMDEAAIADAGNALGQAITDVLLEVFDGLLGE